MRRALAIGRRVEVEALLCANRDALLGMLEHDGATRGAGLRLVLSRARAQSVQREPNLQSPGPAPAACCPGEYELAPRCRYGKPGAALGQAVRQAGAVSMLVWQAAQVREGCAARPNPLAPHLSPRLICAMHLCRTMWLQLAAHLGDGAAHAALLGVHRPRGELHATRTTPRVASMLVHDVTTGGPRRARRTACSSARYERCRHAPAAEHQPSSTRGTFPRMGVASS